LQLQTKALFSTSVPPEPLAPADEHARLVRSNTTRLHAARQYTNHGVMPQPSLCGLRSMASGATLFIQLHRRRSTMTKTCTSSSTTTTTTSSRVMIRMNMKRWRAAISAAPTRRPTGHGARCGAPSEQGYASQQARGGGCHEQ
jgi:hypothetical protein